MRGAGPTSGPHAAAGAGNAKLPYVRLSFIVASPSTGNDARSEFTGTAGS
jgi:hypothetical protein